MLRIVIRHELKLLAADRTLAAVVCALLLLIAFATHTGAGFWRERDRVGSGLIAEAERTLTEDRRAAARLGAATPGPGDEDPASPLGRSYPAVLPPAPLAPLAVGMGDLAPYWATLGIYTLPSAPYRFHEIGNPLNLLAGRFDLAFAIVFLYPLVIVALAYNAVAGEKERGTLTLALAQPLSLRELVLGKLIARASVVVFVAVVLSVLALAASGVSLAAPGAGSRLLLWLALVTAYGLFWYAAAIGVDALGLRSATNAMFLAGLWLVLCVAVPALLQLAASALHPVPSRLEFVADLRRAENAAQQRAAQLLEEFYGDHPELAPAGAIDASDFATRFYAVRLDLDERLRPIVGRFEEQLSRQQELVRRFGYLSPAVLAHEAVLDLAGAGLERQVGFRDQVRAGIARWRQFFVPKVFRRERLTDAEFERWPRFVFSEESAGAVAARVAGPLAGITIAAGLLGVWGLARMRRYPVVGG